MSDLISRQAASGCGYWDSESNFCALHRPSAERRGRWIDGKRMGLDGTFHWFRQCSECLYEREDDNEDKDTPYCPYCGSRMDLDEVEE